MSIDFEREGFVERHLGSNEQQQEQLLEALNVDSLDDLIEETLPAGIRRQSSFELDEPVGESQYLSNIKELADKNDVYGSYIGMGYYNTILPNVIQRNILENPGWYTSYTPYQAEISQGRLEALINFQTMVADLTGMELANASLLDEATAAAEAMSMFHSSRKGQKRKEADTFFVSELCHPQTIDVVKGRAKPMGVNIVVGDPNEVDVTDPELFGMLLQYPNSDGSIQNYDSIIAAATENKVQTVVASDLLSLTLLTPPGEMGADAVVGSSQRFGVPMGYGGPHAGFFATNEGYKRKIPGRIIGVTKDEEGNPVYRMALQTREQHIRRQRATSNICTAQVLLAVMAGMYGVYHGPEGLKRIARRVAGLTEIAAQGLQEFGFTLQNETYFDTLTVELESNEIKEAIRERALEQNLNFRYYDDARIGLSFDEAKDLDDVKQVLAIFKEVVQSETDFSVDEIAETVELDFGVALNRDSDFMTNSVFHRFHSEHDMMRYMKRLENKDLSLAHSMITLGSCTMKLNAAAEMMPLTWPEFGQMHPFAPVDQAAGYHQLFDELEHQLAQISGFDSVSLQPNSGAQGEFSGLMTIRAYHRDNGEAQRNVAIIPDSAHGTNPASAVMAGMKVVITKCDDKGNIDLDDLREKAEKHQENLAALMVTYPSTHGIFEEDIKEICEVIHENGGLVYIDGANMNAEVGLVSLAELGGDVCHLNLHKTFCIPHGGGGPGVGPIAVTEQLKPFLPGNTVVSTGGDKAINGISAAPWGSASILTISYGFIRMMGDEGLTKATKTAILNANYLKKRLEEHYPVLYSGKNGRAAHEFIVDVRPFKKSVGVDAADVAKRLMDYGFHAPTMSFPVPGTLMIEPTESESKEELDRFCDALISIRKEIQEIEDGTADKEDNVLVNAPHTQRVVMDDAWNHTYSREKAVFPVDRLRFNKFWPAVSRVDDAYGDRNLVCSCLPVEAYSDGQKVMSEES